MTVLPNSFRVRAAEFNRGRASAFCNNFAFEVLDILEPHHFDIPVLLRSVPGAGKTSLMQALSAQWLVEVVRRPADYENLADRLAALGVLDKHRRPTISGALINLERDFSSILDVGAPAEAAERIFKRLVDARVLSAHIASARTLSEPGDSFDEGEISLVIPKGRPDLTAILRELGSPSDDRIESAVIESWAIEIETVVRTLLFDLDPFDWKRINSYTNDFVSFKLLEAAEIHLDGRDTGLRPVTFLDDLHRLREEQREQLITLIESRAVTRGLWVAERVEVLNAEQLVGEDEHQPSRARVRAEDGRDWEIIVLGSFSSPPRTVAYDRMLKSVARKRAATDLQNYADTGLDFLQLLDDNDEIGWRKVEEDLTRRLEQVADAKFVNWVARLLDPATASPKGDAQRVKDMRAGLSLIEAEQRKEQQELFLGIPLPAGELDRRLNNSGTREASLVTLGREYPNDIPIYFGQRDFLVLANQNVSQLLRVAADLFDVVLSATANTRTSPAPTPRQQHRTIKTTSDRFWREIPSRLADGASVQTLLDAAGRFANRINQERPTSYLPGISGFAMTMNDLRLLLDEHARRNIPGGDKLLTALAESVANNYLTKLEDASRGANSDRRVVFYINRLLCPQWNLPLGRGGYRTKSVREIGSWMNRRPTPTRQDFDEINEVALRGLFDD